MYRAMSVFHRLICIILFIFHLMLMEFSRCQNNDTLPRISYGEVVNDITEFPHQAAMFCISRQAVYCGATVIDASWVLTAAHCIDNCPNYFGVIAGTHDISVKTAQIIPGRRAIRHEDWDPKAESLKNDIALVELFSPLTLSEKVKPAIGLVGEYQRNEKVWITGWGNTQNIVKPNILRKAQIPVVSTYLCSALFVGKLDSKTMICAGEGNGVDTCTGDSGGPLGKFDKKGNFILGGIISFGADVGCGAQGNRGVYTKISAYKDWIQQYVNFTMSETSGARINSTKLSKFLISLSLFKLLIQIFGISANS